QADPPPGFPGAPILRSYASFPARSSAQERLQAQPCRCLAPTKVERPVQIRFLEPRFGGRCRSPGRGMAVATQASYRLRAHRDRSTGPLPMTVMSLWLGIGFLGQSLFFMRFFVQWIVSERSRKSVVPKAFWYFS